MPRRLGRLLAAHEAHAARRDLLQHLFDDDRPARIGGIRGADRTIDLGHAGGIADRLVIDDLVLSRGGRDAVRLLCMSGKRGNGRRHCDNPSFRLHVSILK